MSYPPVAPQAPVPYAVVQPAPDAQPAYVIMPDQQPPAYDALFAEKYRFKPASPKYQDFWAYVLFLMHFVVIGALLIVAEKNQPQESSASFSPSDVGLTRNQLYDVYRVILMLCAAGICLGTSYCVSLP